MYVNGQYYVHFCQHLGTWGLVRALLALDQKNVLDAKCTLDRAARPDDFVLWNPCAFTSAYLKVREQE